MEAHSAVYYLGQGKLRRYYLYGFLNRYDYELRTRFSSKETLEEYMRRNFSKTIQDYDLDVSIDIANAPFYELEKEAMMLRLSGHNLM